MAAYLARGCRHCVCCNNVRQHASGRDGANPWLELWPAGLQSPTVYYALKTRQLAFQIKAVAAEGPEAWRQHSASAGRPNALLAARSRPQLSLRVPHTRCGVEARDTAVYVRSIEPRRAADRTPQQARRAAPPPPAPPRLAVAASDFSFSSSCGSARSVASSGSSVTSSVTPLRLLEKPAKRSRLDAGAAAAAAAAVPQQRVAPGHVSRAMCMSPRGHSAHLIAPAQRQRSGPVVIPMPTAGARTRRAGAAAAAAADNGGSPFLGWLQMLRGMLTPEAEAVAAC